MTSNKTKKSNKLTMPAIMAAEWGLTSALALSLGEIKIHKANTIRHRQNLKSGREGRAGSHTGAV